MICPNCRRSLGEDEVDLTSPLPDDYDETVSYVVFPENQKAFEKIQKRRDGYVDIDRKARKTNGKKRR